MSLVDYAGFVQRTPIIVSILLEPIAQVSLKYLFYGYNLFLVAKITNKLSPTDQWIQRCLPRVFGVNYGKTFLVWICAVIFLLVLKDFIIYSKEEQYKK